LPEQASYKNNKVKFRFIWQGTWPLTISCSVQQN
jgi:hypothetical protein